MNNYTYYNANPNKFDIEDCAIRSISTIEGISWDKAYKILSNHARRQGLMISSVEAVESYLDSKYPRECYNNTSVGEFAKDHPYGKYLVTMKGHITAIKHGKIIDTFDCSKREMWCAWEVW